MTQWTAALQASCPSPTPTAHSNSCPSTGWCYSNISSIVVHFSSCLQSFTAARSFQMNQFLASGGQNIGVLALASFLQWICRTNSFRMDWLYLLAVQGTLMSLLQHHSSKAPIFLVFSFLNSPNCTSIHDYCKNYGFDWTDRFWQTNVFAF